MTTSPDPSNIAAALKHRYDKTDMDEVDVSTSTTVNSPDASESPLHSSNARDFAAFHKISSFEVKPYACAIIADKSVTNEPKLDTLKTTSQQVVKNRKLILTKHISFQMPSLGLDIVKMCSESTNMKNSDCFNDPFIPENASSLEHSFHSFLETQNMKEINVERFLDD